MPPIDLIYRQYLKTRIISTDTRTIVQDCLFFALKGENFDANTFAESALNQGAAYAIIDNPKYQLNDRCILVEDVLKCLQDLARHHRNTLNIPVVGLTGSNGKTTTKELINVVLSEQFKTFATKGNLNNHIGVPLSILSIMDDTEIAIIEMGANHQKEIEFLCSICQPSHGLITNIGMAHLDGFGGFEGVKKGKAELFHYLYKTGGVTFVNRNDNHVMEMSTAASLKNLVYYGTQGDNLVTGTLLDSDPMIGLRYKIKDDSFTVVTNLTGAYNFENILASICIGSYFGLQPKQINAGLSNYQPKNNRSQLTKTASNMLICDFYNANPSSMTAALKNLSSLTSEHKTAIIGDMFELGEESIIEHQKIADLAANSGFDLLLLIGKNFFSIADKSRGHFFKTPKEAEDWIKEHPVSDSLVLLKGSRGIAMEQLLPLL